MCGNKGFEMNERIKELAKQAEEYADIEYNASDLDWYELKEEKFAELIVKECAKVIFETPVEYIETDTMHRIRDRVKQHFGVNE